MLHVMQIFASISNHSDSRVALDLSIMNPSRLVGVGQLRYPEQRYDLGYL